MPSQSGGKPYDVDPAHGTCTCPDRKNGNKCKHIYAVEITIKREQNSDGTITKTKSITFTEKKTYPQDWRAYNVAQITEKERFRFLLHDLCCGFRDTLPVTGRYPVPLRDRLFASCYKIYSTVSARRFGTDLKEAHERKFLTRGLHPNKISCFLESPNADCSAQDDDRSEQLAAQSCGVYFRCGQHWVQRGAACPLAR